MDVLVDGAFAADAKLTLDIDESVTDIGSVLGTLTGTQDGKEIADGGIIAPAAAGSWCISTFYVSMTSTGTMGARSQASAGAGRQEGEL